MKHILIILTMTLSLSIMAQADSKTTYDYQAVALLRDVIHCLPEYKEATSRGEWPLTAESTDVEFKDKTVRTLVVVIGHRHGAPSFGASTTSQLEIKRVARKWEGPVAADAGTAWEPAECKLVLLPPKYIR